MINCTGICKGMSTASIEYCSEIELLWKSVSSDGSKPTPDASRRVMFSELPEGSDALLLGYPLLAEWGTTRTRTMMCYGSSLRVSE